MKVASIVYFYMGDSPAITLAQETVPLHKAMQGYDRVVLLKQDVDAGPFDLSARAEKRASAVLAPTLANLAESLVELDAEGYDIDLYIFSHGSPEAFTHYWEGEIDGKPYAGPVKAKGSTLEGLVGRELPHLRYVYSIACYGATLHPMWLRLGAKGCIGTRDVNFYPTRFRRYIRAFQATHQIAPAVVASEQAEFAKRASALYLGALAGPRVPKGPLAFGVQYGPAVEAYFHDDWGVVPPEPGMTAREIMDWSSEQIIDIASPRLR